MDREAWFGFVRAIAADLSKGKVVFPTSFETTLRLRDLLRSGEASAQDVVRAVAGDPLLSSRIVQLANSAAFARAGARVSDIRGAVVRIGIDQVRNLASAVAMSQMVTYRNMLPYKEICNGMIGHSRRVAALAAVLARNHSSQDPGKAFFTGLIHDIGVFYLIFRLSERTEFFTSLQELSALLHDWHGQVGHAVLATLDVPEDIQQAIADHDEPRPVRSLARLSDLLYVANLIAQRAPESRAPIGGADAAGLGANVENLEAYLHSVGDAEAELAELTRSVL